LYNFKQGSGETQNTLILSLWNTKHSKDQTADFHSFSGLGTLIQNVRA